jgi:hypothetical protein
MSASFLEPSPTTLSSRGCGRTTCLSFKLAHYWMAAFSWFFKKMSVLL